jgi:hypothetical protein
MKTGGARRLVWTAALLAGCGGREAFWSTPTGPSPISFNLTSQVAVLDGPADRVLLLAAGPNQSLTTTSVKLGVNVLNAVLSPDGTKLYVVSGGHRAQLGDRQPAEPPSVTVIGSGPPQRYDLTNLTEPLGGLAVDPAGQWLVLYPDSQRSSAVVQNPNQLVILDLSQPPETSVPVTHTLMSFGGRPQRFTFTPPLMLPIGKHPLLIVESDQDVSLLRLDDPNHAAEITVPLTNGADTHLLSPAGVAVYPGDDGSGAFIGVRLANDDDVVALQFVANVDASGQPVGNGFLPTVNLNNVGGVASDIAFVHTDTGLRLAALVPTRSKATLIDPATNLTTDVALPAAYQSMSIVTGSLPSPNGCTGVAATAAATDVALLWNGNTAQGQQGVALWELGQTGCQPFRSIDTVGITNVVGAVFDVPPPNATLKVLQGRNTGAFYILNLQNRTAAPFEAPAGNLAISISPLGDQVWSYLQGGQTVFATDFAHELPRSLLIERPVIAVHEVTRGPQETPAVIVLHDGGALGATVYDATSLDDSTRRLYTGLLLEGAP